MKSAVLQEIEQRLEAAGLHIAVEEDGDRLVLSGEVDSAADSQAAEDIVGELAPNRTIDNGLEIVAELPTPAGGWTSDDPNVVADLPDDVREIREEGGDVDPDLTDQPLLTDPIAAPGPSGSYEDEVGEGDETYFPPTDPVTTVDRHGQTQVLGGFSAGADQDIVVPRSAEDGRIGDEAINDAVRQELRRDASTAGLAGLRVAVRDGVVYLRGRVPLLEDAENAEEVAGRVPGVVEVVEELEVEGM